MEPMLSDEQRARIAPLLPPRKPRGRPRADDRQTLEGLLWVLGTGSRWQGLPREYGSKTRCHRRLKEWQEQGVWERVWRALPSLDRGEAPLGEGLFGCHLRPGQGAGVGLTRRGKGSKVMLVVEGQGLPSGLLVESAQKSEVRLADGSLGGPSPGWAASAGWW